MNQGFLFGVFLGGLILGALAAWGVGRGRRELAREQGRNESLAAWAQERAELAARQAETDMQLLMERDAAHERIQGLMAAEERLAGTFRELSAQVFQANSERFLQLAQSKFAESRAGAQADLAGRQQALDRTLEPLTQSLAQLQAQLAQLDAGRAESAGTLSQQLLNLAQSQQALQAETGRLAMALRKPEVRGTWGEVQLRNVVEYAGMKEHVDFITQASMDVDERRRRPDLLVKLPGEKLIAVDAKVPLQAYLEALEAEPGARGERLAAVAAQLRGKVVDLAGKHYFDGLQQSPDFVVLFLPMEALFSVALEQDPALLDFALAKGVIIATPTTLVAMLQAAAYGWSQERVNQHAELIQATATELYNACFTLAGHVDDLRKGLVAAVRGFNGFAGSLERNVLVKARSLAGLGLRASRKGKDGKELALAAVPLLAEQPRGLDKLGVRGPDLLEADFREEPAEPGAGSDLPQG